MSRVIEQLIIGHMHVTIYASEFDDEIRYAASFEPDPNESAHGYYEQEHLDDLATAAQAADLIIRCHEQRLGVLEAAERLHQLGVVIDRD